MASVTTLEKPSIFSAEQSVFVSANAGSGKTSLLTKRVLSLLVQGVRPGAILCLTFTNAAAAEMSSRVLAELGKWVMLKDDKLSSILEELTQSAPTPATLRRARSLFASVLDAPDGVRIQTIHGFCQSLLRRFPIEAAISPHFTVMDTRSEEEALHEARQRLFARMSGSDAPVQQAMHALAADSGEYTVQEILAYIIANKRKFMQLVTQKPDLDYSCQHIWEQLGLRPDTSFETLQQNHLSYTDTYSTALRAAANQLLQSKSKEDNKKGQLLADWLVAGNRTPQAAETYFTLFFTQTGSPRKTLHTKAGLTDEALVQALQEEAERVGAFRDGWLALEIARRSNHVLVVAHSLLSIYDALKQGSAWLDYDDLIYQATRLLQQPDISPWVLYKLDGGIDHVLVDEAQDTSPQQWGIIQAVTDDFFAGQGRSQQERSLFIVGDEKQSIYRFQGADVAALRHMQDFFQQKIQASAGQAQRVELIRSYRSLSEILSVVDVVCSQPVVRECIAPGRGELQHSAHRTGGGVVELWPLITKDEDAQYPVQNRLVWQVADQIEHWLSEGMVLPSTGKAITPGDIMILVRTRTALVEKLSRALKRKHIPVAGVDRMQLMDNLAVQDLVALGQFLLLPEDDLTLACVLKSPIGNISEDTLFELAHDRGLASLWHRLADHEGCSAIHALLSELLAKTDFLSPYALYAHLLDTLGIRKYFLGRMGVEYADPIDEFLQQALYYEHSHIPSLQGFLHWLSGSEAEIKRDMEQQENAVRIMTVHGAKGLQAPLVILPDTTGQPKTDTTAFWSHSGIPFWPRSKAQYCEYVQALYDAEKQQEFAEYCRQLYVAMTRAKDMLCIAGAVAAKAVQEHSWYGLAHAVLHQTGTPFDATEGTGFRVGAPFASSQPAGGTEAAAPAERSNLLEFLTHKAPAEPTPSRPLAPSRMADDAPTPASPLAQRRVYGQGRFIHSLLQYLPDYEQGQWQQVALNITAPYRHTMDEQEIQAAIQETLSVLSHPEFAFLFSEGSLAEVPVTGTVEIGGQPLTFSGQIDRLYVGEEIWVVDYKTGHLPPSRPEAVPAPYRRQLALYKKLLEGIYPQQAIRCALLWTVAPQITELSPKLLDEAL